MGKKVVFQTKSTSETIRLGKRIGGLLRPGDVVALAGELGAGKTQFIKGLAEGAGVGKPTYISSPSFTLIVSRGIDDDLGMNRTHGRDDPVGLRQIQCRPVARGHFA